MPDKHYHTWVWRVKEKPCPNCHGKGTIQDEKCQKCKGEGIVKYQYQICDTCGVGSEDYYGQRKYNQQFSVLDGAGEIYFTRPHSFKPPNNC